MKAINIFLKKEIEDKMFDREIFGINYWEYVRPVISCETNSIISGGSAMFAKNPFCFKKYFLNLKNIRKYLLKKQKCDIYYARNMFKLNYNKSRHKHKRSCSL